MFSLIFKFFDFFKREESNLNSCDTKINSAIKLQKEGSYLRALKIYSELYKELKEKGKKEKLALVINNMLVIKHELKQDSKELYNELCDLRFSLMLRDEECFTIDYIYTILMGVEWFNMPKNKLENAKKMLNMYKQFSIYKPILDKINLLA